MKNEKEEAKMPEEKITINIEGDPIELELPTVGGFISIERRKIQLSGNYHRNMLDALTNASVFSYAAIEMIATIEVLVKDISKRLKVDSLIDVKPHQLIALQKEYTEKVFPWLESWRKFINAPMKEADEETDN